METKKKCLIGNLFDTLNETLSYYENHVCGKDFKRALFDMAMEIGAMKNGQTGYIHLPLYSSEYDLFSFSKDVPKSGSYIKVVKIIGVEYLLDFTALYGEFVIVANYGTATTFPGDVICVYEDYLSAYSNMVMSDKDIVPLKDYAESIGKKVEELDIRYF